jgi:acyl-coenzyme A thioesterase PaaI-like protein
MLEALNAHIGKAIPFTHRNGYEVIELKPGYVKSRIGLEGNTNHMGSMYAGAMFLLAEIPGGVLSLQDFGMDYIPILRDMKMEFKAMATSDLTMEINMSQADIDRLKQEVASEGKAHFELKGELKDAKGQVVALSTALYQLRRARQAG